MFSNSMISQWLSIWTIEVTYWTIKPSRYNMFVFNVHFNISWNLWAVSTFCTAPRAFRYFVNHCFDLRVQVCKTCYLWCLSVWFLNDFLFGQKMAQYGQEKPPELICLDSTWLAQFDFFLDKNPQLRHSHPSALFDICFMMAISNSIKVTVKMLKITSYVENILLHVF